MNAVNIILTCMCCNTYTATAPVLYSAHSGE